LSISDYDLCRITNYQLTHFQTGIIERRHN
jgi:hypothetical protein